MRKYNQAFFFVRRLLKSIGFSLVQTVSATQPSTEDTEPTNGDVDENQKWLETSWCVLDLAGTNQDIFTGLETPEQISIVAASYFSKQLRMFTDAVISMKLLDDIFKLFMVKLYSQCFTAIEFQYELNICSIL